MSKYTALFFLYLFPFTLFGQRSSMRIGFSDPEELFVFNVSDINEFITRFNDSPSLTKSYIVKKYPDYQDLSRDTLISLLFDLQNPDLDTNDVKDFVKGVTNYSPLTYLNFTDKGWYAEVGTVFNYQSQDYLGTMLLRINLSIDSCISWVITDINLDFLKTDSALINEMKLKDSIDIEADSFLTLSPMDHILDFIKLRYVLKNNKPDLISYLDPETKSDRVDIFLHKYLNGEINFKEAEYIKYHFLQIDDWIFTVENKIRNSKNSGWLISNLFRANESEKLKYLQLIKGQN